MIIESGYSGTPLRDILAQLGNKPYKQIVFRCKWTENEQAFDEFTGACSYDGTKLTSLDYDSYSLDDLYTEWQEDGDILTVWEQGSAIR